MAQTGITAEIKDNKLVVSIPITPAPSKSHKSILVASTHGNVTTLIQYQGKPLMLNLSAYVSAS